MSLDDLVLSLQRALDRLVRRLRRGGAPVPMQRRLLIVQIDGLSRVMLDQGLASGRMPFLKRLLRHHGYHLEPMTVGLPTSTPAFQMAVMYGVRPDIPGFHYYDREDRSDIHFPRPGHAARVEAKHAAGRRGILHGGSAYGCVFTGDADNNLFSFTSLTQPSGRGLLCLLSPFVVVSWVCTKNLLRTSIELARAVSRFAMHPVEAKQGWRWLTIQIGLSVWVRGFFTLAVCRDLYILADHGQTPCTPYWDLSGGHRFERWIFDELLDPMRAGLPDTTPCSSLAGGIRARRRGATELLQHFLNYLDEDFLRRREPEAHQQNGIRVITAGPNAFLYILDGAAPLDAEALERRLPGLAEKLSQSPGVGFVLARSGNGPVCFWHGKRHQLRESELGPFTNRADASLVVQGITDLMTMPSAGDLVIYGIDAPQGHVSFIPEMGAHAGPSPDELHTFIVRPAKVALPSPISHPVQLYDHFMRYQEPS